MRLAPVKRHWTLVQCPGRVHREPIALAEAVTESFWGCAAGWAELTPIGQVSVPLGHFER
jgi:hypothetical protein